MADIRTGEHQVGIYKAFGNKLRQEVAAAKACISAHLAHPD